MSNAGGLIAEQAPFQQLGAAMFRLLREGDERIEYLATVLSPVTYERMRAYSAAGKLDSRMGRFDSIRRPRDLSALLETLREATYRDGLCTWFSVKIAVTSAGGATAEYNYDDEPEWDAPVDPVSYVKDLEKFPRDEDKQPAWLEKKLAGGRAKLAARGS